ncbi:MAG TPA: alpha-glucosidase [Rectinemataceae bacterium]|nr:alpha-glucosidase [Rectinemataceae bacterium]
MICVEPTQDGFIFSVEGRRIFSHSRRSPCVEIGTAETSVKSGRGYGGLRRRGAVRNPLRTCKIVENGEGFVAIDFDGRLRLGASYKDSVLRLSFSRYDSSINMFRFRMAAYPDERIYGGGERQARLDLKLSRVPLWVEDRGVGHGSGLIATFSRRASGSTGDGNATPFPVPAFISTLNYWCAIDTSAFVRIDFKRSSTVIDAWGVPREISLGFARDPAATIGAMTATIGRQSAPPSWCYDGAWLGFRGPQAELTRKLQRVLDAGVKVAALHASDWSGHPLSGKIAPWDLSLPAAGTGSSGTAYPDLEGFIAGLRGRGIRFLGYVNPLLSTKGRLYAEASTYDYCVKDAAGHDYLLATPQGTAALVDLSSAEAFSWIKDVLRRELIDRGMSGWMADGGECLPPEARLASGESGLLAHNRWPVLWAQANREAIEETGSGSEALFFVRSGWLGSARSAGIVWAGDRLADFSREDGLPSVVPAALSLGLSGIGFWHSEIGGSSTAAWLRRSRECLDRWTEMAAFTPFFRTSEGQRPEANAQHWSDDSSLALLARMSEVYAALKPYHLAVGAEYVRTGLPPLRHPWLAYPEDAESHRLIHQYLYGRDLMVAPVLEAKRELTKLYLPEDEWVHLWSSRVFRRGTVLVDSPAGCPAVFYRASSAFAPLFDAIRRTVRRL